MVLSNLDWTTKELVKTYEVDDMFQSRTYTDYVSINGHLYSHTGTVAALFFVGDLYKVYDPSVKSYKYVLVVGRSQQCLKDGTSKEAKLQLKEKGDILVETASLNAKTNPIAVIEISNENFDSIIPLLLQSLLGSNKREFLNEDNNLGMFNDKNLMELEAGTL